MMPWNSLTLRTPSCRTQAVLELSCNITEPYLYQTRGTNSEALLIHPQESHSPPRLRFERNLLLLILIHQIHPKNILYATIISFLRNSSFHMRLFIFRSPFMKSFSKNIEIKTSSCHLHCVNYRQCLLLLTNQRLGARLLVTIE